MLAAALGMLLLGCPGTGAGAPAKVCKHAYEQCTLSSGLLGICDVADCAEGQTAPCLVCRSQH
jgi:hypothetical protein